MHELAKIRREEARSLAALLIEGHKLSVLVRDLAAAGLLPARWKDEAHWSLRQFRRAWEQYDQASRQRAVARGDRGQESGVRNKARS